jgi:hypothetical protein
MTRKPVVVQVNDKMQHGYSYLLTAPMGRNFDPVFRPELTPKEMLALGVFCGKYMTDCRDEFPASWSARARLLPPGRDHWIILVRSGRGLRCNRKSLSFGTSSMYCGVNRESG